MVVFLFLTSGMLQQSESYDDHLPAALVPPVQFLHNIIRILAIWILNF